jgi:transcriptional antiterminator NusG
MDAPESTITLPFFAVQVRTGGEAVYMSYTLPILEPLGMRVFWPRRSLRIRRRGKWHDVQAPIFSGYVFLQAPGIDADLYWKLKKAPGFYRFLRNNQDIQPLPQRDAHVLNRLLRYGHVVGKSVAEFDENNRIRILEGPLKGLEGLIVKVDRRKGRAKVKLDLYDEAHLVDFGFTSLEKTHEE